MRTIKPVDVVCALVVDNGKLLIVQHGPSSRHPWKWEFPGGKVHPGETPEAALVREIREELEMEIQIIIPLEPAGYAYPDKTIQLIPFLCLPNSGKLYLHEHARYEWVSLDELSVYDLLPPDRALLKIEMNEKNLTVFMSKTHL
jgi:8-oxo-dGTP diphosphatase